MTARSLALAVLLAAPTAARAEPAFHGFLSERLQLTMPREDALLSTRDLPILHSLTEANVQGRARLLEERLLVSVDASAFAIAQGGYADYDLVEERQVGVDEHDVASARPFFVVSEAFASLEPFEHLVLTAGKRRVVWGPGQAVSPTDLWNPPRDPTDPSSQRAGALLLAVDVPLQRFSLSALFLPAVLAESSGIPYAVLAWPEHPFAETLAHPDAFPDRRDDRLHYAAVLRVYALLFEADWNAFAFWSNLYQDEAEDDLKLAFTVSKTLGFSELHGEVLLQRGSARLFPNEACLPDEAALAACARAGARLFVPAKLDEDRILPRILVGWRAMLEDESLVSLEYLYQADGLLPRELGELARLQARIGEAQRKGLAPASLGPALDGGGAPLRFASQPLRRHHVFASYTKPRILDDITAQGTLIVAAEDLSSLVAGSLAWTAQEWLSLSLHAFAPLPSAGRLSSLLPGDPLDRADRTWDDGARGFLPVGAWVDGTRYGEYDLLPFSGRVLAEARVWF